MHSHIKAVVDAIESGAVGEWWLPKKPEARKTAVLKRGNVFFDLTMADAAPIGGEESTILHGLVADVPITLADCQRFNAISESYSAIVVFVGVHADGPWPSFSKCIFEFEPIDDWASNFPFKVSFPGAQVVSTYDRKEDTIAKLGDGSSVTVRYLFSTNGKPATLTERESAAFVVELPSPKTWPEISREWRFAIDTMLGFALQRPVFVTAIEGLTGGKECVILSPHGMRSRADGEENDDDRGNTRLLFRFKASDFERVFQRWKALCDQHGIIVSWITGYLWQADVYHEQEFVAAAQAAEAIHRAFFDHEIIEKKRFSQLLKEIEGALPSGVPEDLRSRIVGGLPFMNTPTFQERLTELLAKFETFSSLLHNVDDFVRDVKKTRNDLVHLNRQPKLMKDNFEKYVASADFLRLLTCEVILDHLGFSLDERKKIWSRNSTHLGLKARLNKPASKQETF